MLKWGKWGIISHTKKQKGALTQGLPHMKSTIFPWDFIWDFEWISIFLGENEPIVFIRFQRKTKTTPKLRTARNTQCENAKVNVRNHGYTIKRMPWPCGLHGDKNCSREERSRKITINVSTFDTRRMRTMIILLWTSIPPSTISVKRTLISRMLDSWCECDSQR